MDTKELALLILKAQSIMEKSWDDSKEMDWDGGRYRLDHFQSACEALNLPYPTQSEGAGIEYVVYLLNSTYWNDIKLWATEQLGVKLTRDYEKNKEAWAKIESMLDTYPNQDRLSTDLDLGDYEFRDPIEEFDE